MPRGDFYTGSSRARNATDWRIPIFPPCNPLPIRPLRKTYRLRPFFASSTGLRTAAYMPVVRNSVGLMP